MVRPGTFERVYAAIGQQLRSGMLRPGERLEPVPLSEQLNASVTPVRDALHRLTGERLVEAPRHEGFRVPLLTETMLRHLFGWQLDNLLLATARPARERRRPADAGGDAPAQQCIRDLFACLAESSDNPEHLAALRNIAERLDPYRRFEPMFLDALDAERDEMLDAVAGGDRSRIRRSLVHYHRRRQRIVPEALEELRRGSAARKKERGRGASALTARFISRARRLPGPANNRWVGPVYAEDMPRRTIGCARRPVRRMSN